MKLSKYIDHTLLKANATEPDILKLCNEAIKEDFASVCINPTFVSYASSILKDTDVKVCTVIGFPLGATTKEVKAFETKNATQNGANEIDMVINVGALKDKRYDYVYDDIKAVVDAADGNTVKVIIETVLLTDDEKVKACEISLKAGAHFVKTSTGFSTAGIPAGAATKEDIELMKKTVKDKAEVKASGGVKTPEDLDIMIKAGATRIGTSSGILLLQGKDSNTDY